MERWLPDDLVDHIHRLATADGHHQVMTELRGAVHHSLAGFEACGDQRAEIYELHITDGPRHRRTLYWNGGMSPDGLHNCVLHANAVHETPDGEFLAERRHTLLASPVDNKVAAMHIP